MEDGPKTPVADRVIRRKPDGCPIVCRGLLEATAEVRNDAMLRVGCGFERAELDCPGYMYPGFRKAPVRRQKSAVSAVSVSGVRLYIEDTPELTLGAPPVQLPFSALGQFEIGAR